MTVFQLSDVNTLQTIITIVVIGVLILAGGTLLKFVLKLAWRFLTIGLLLVAGLFVLGYFLGFINLSIG